MRVLRRSYKGVETDVVVPFRSPFTLSADPSIGTGGGIDLNAVERVLEGGFPRPVLTKTEARVAWLLLEGPGLELSASEVAGLVGVDQRTVVRWRTGETAAQVVPESWEKEADMKSEEWRDRALCTVAPEEWFPATYHARPVWPIRVCWACPVQLECLSWALAREKGRTGKQRQFEGVCGGYTPAERALIQEQIDAGVPAVEGVLVG